MATGNAAHGAACCAYEVQRVKRVKRAKELARRSTSQTLTILDEPTTGLHFEDVRKLLEVLHRLVEQGNSIVVIEHNLHVIKPVLSQSKGPQTGSSTWGRWAA